MFYTQLASGIMTDLRSILGDIQKGIIIYYHRFRKYGTKNSHIQLERVYRLHFLLLIFQIHPILIAF